MHARKRLPPLNALKAFESAARLGGFTAAGEELCVSPGAISRHVANLESFLGVQLFRRGHNEVRLTAEGSSYLGKIQEAMDSIAEASCRDVSAAVPQLLHVSGLPTFTERWLLPRLHSFIAQHPNASVRISTSVEEVDWDKDRADVSIYASDEGWVGRGEHLFESSMVPVCSPSYRARLQQLPSVEDLAAQTLISSINKRTDWHRWLYSGGLRSEATVPQLMMGTSALAYKAAIEGLGLVCAEREFIHDDLAAGRLVALSERTLPGNSYFMEFRPGKRPTNLASQFTQWLLAQAR